MNTNKDIQELSDEQIIAAFEPHIDSFPSTKAGEESYWITKGEVIAFTRAILATRQSAPITCQIYGHVVGHCAECNVGDEAAADVAGTNKVLADNYLRQTCTAAPIAAAAQGDAVGQQAGDNWGVTLAGMFAWPELHHSTRRLVIRFAHALADKLDVAERKYGYSNSWEQTDWMDKCRADLLEHVGKGDPRDVAAYCAFLWHHGEKTSLAQRAASQPEAKPFAHITSVPETHSGSMAVIHSNTGHQFTKADVGMVLYAVQPDTVCTDVANQAINDALRVGMEGSERDAALLNALQAGLDSATDLLSDAPRSKIMEISRRIDIIRAAIGEQGKPS